MKIGVALGSNLGDRLTNLRAAKTAIVELPGVRTPILLSAIYETEPIDCEPGAAKFLNAAMEFDYKGDPRALLEELIRIEESLGRERDHGRNISRKIDLDLLYGDEIKLDDDDLRLPHPRLHLRKFVLQPVADIRPNLVVPGQTQTVRELLAQSTDSSKVVRFNQQWETA
jgi:2-amino-4-hydroxy-6-hydroxymethyldihydropteridine diphosphokinase